ncbi:hypothetical protein [Granulicella aggregans]|nr:hypothetical protein [Granulicella aggregans]
MSKKTGLPVAELVDFKDLAEVVAQECCQPAAFEVRIGVVGSSIGAGYACIAHGEVLSRIEGFVVTSLNAG